MNDFPNQHSSLRSTKPGGELPGEYRGILGSWYRLTAPPPPPPTATIDQRQRAARGQLTSGTLLLMIIMVLAAEPVAITGPNKALIFVLFIPISIDLVALVFNRVGQIRVAGILVIVGIEVGILLSIIGPALGGKGLSTYTLPQYDLLVQATLVAVTLLPPRSVILVVLFHSILTIATILYLPHSAEFAAVYAANTYEVFLRPFTLQVTVGVVTYLWVVIADQAIRRADRAEEIAALERREVERRNEEIQRNQQLEEGIRQVLLTLNKAANGDFATRARISQENLLYRVGYAVNTLLARLQSFRAERAELEKTRKVAEVLATAFREQRSLLFSDWTGTCLDPLIREIQGSGLHPPHPPITPSSFSPQRKAQETGIAPHSFRGVPSPTDGQS